MTMFNFRTEPVRSFVLISTLVTLLVDGSVVFSLWEPEPAQLAYLNGFVTVIAGAFGFNTVRNAVTPEWRARERIEQARR